MLIQSTFLNPGLLLKRYRINSNLTLREAAKKANLDYTFLSKIELGQRIPSLESLLAIGKTYEISLDIIKDIARQFGLSGPHSITGSYQISYGKKTNSNNTNREGVKITWTILRTIR